jgi:nucleoid-associated protein YgaU
MKRFLLIVLGLSLLFSLSAKMTYLDQQEFKHLKHKEKLQYNQDAQQEMTQLQQRKADAVAKQNQLTQEINDLNGQIAQKDQAIKDTHAAIYAMLGVKESDLASVQDKIKFFNSQLDNWNKLSDDELWNTKKQIVEFISDYRSYRQTNYTKLPEVYKQFSDLDVRINSIEQKVNGLKPKADQHDTYKVVKGDYLAKIAGYDFIYGDPKKWGIIYRANRDQIKDPNVIRPAQILNIPRGNPSTWKVFRGETLWRIASYPEVYGKGSEWTKIYQDNKDQIKDPNKIYPGQVFKLPRD